MKAYFTKYRLATAVAILFHVIGLVGILFSGNPFFIYATPLNLLLMFFLILWTQESINSSFFIFLSACFIIGFFAEVVGVHTGFLFGSYTYGKVLGPSALDVPLIIAVNWFLVIYCCGIGIHNLLQVIIRKIPAETHAIKPGVKMLSVIIDAATLAVFYDWIMEPVAVKLNFWKWNTEGSIPLLNYVSWFAISVLLLTIFHFCKFDKQNKFAVNLLLIQLMFFLILRTFLH